MAVTPDVRIHVEELVLDGFAPSEGHRIGEAIERELARLVVARGMPHRLMVGGTIALLDGGAFQAPSGASGDVLGTRVAQAVYRGGAT